MGKLQVNQNRRISKLSNNNKILLLLGIGIVVILIINFLTSLANLGDVDILVLKNAVPQEGRITEANLQVAKMSKGDFAARGTYKASDGKVKSAIVRAEDKSKIANAYASYYLRQNTPIYWDSLSKETPKKYSYLYKMDGELLYVDIDAKTFGQMLVPGDHINVRVAYNEELYQLQTEDEYRAIKESGISPQTSAPVQTKLFNDVAILDMLNSSGESIFDLYYELVALPKAQQQKLIDDEDFLSRVEPAKVLLNVTPEEADNYMSILDKGPQMLITLLPRTSSNLISEALNGLETGFARKSNK